MDFAELPSAADASPQKRTGTPLLSDREPLGTLWVDVARVVVEESAVVDESDGHGG